MANSAQELKSEYDNLVLRRDRVLPEIARVSADLAKARAVVLSETDAFARARALSSRLSELAKERDALDVQIERMSGQPQHAQQ